MIRKRGNSWQVDLTVDGKRKRRQFATHEEAVAFERSQLPQESRLDSSGTYPYETLSTFSRTCLGFLWGQSDHVLKVRSHLNEMIEVLGDIPVSHFTDDHVDKLLTHYHAQGNSNGTINRKWASLSKFFKKAEKKGLIQKLPDFPRQKESKGRIRFLTYEEEDSLFGYIDQFNPYEHDFAVFLVDTGARFSEALKIQGRDVNKEERKVTFWETKSGESRSVYLTSRAMQTILDSPTPEKPFGTINRWTFRDHWDKSKELAGLGEDRLVIPHVLRHTCASRLVQGGMDIRRVQEWMGHKSLAMTMRYSHLAPLDLVSCVEVLERGRGEIGRHERLKISSQ